MRITLELKGQALVNFNAAIKTLGIESESPHWRRALAAHLINVSADAVARAGWFQFPPIGCAMDLRPWTANEWTAHGLFGGDMQPALAFRPKKEVRP